MGDNSDSSSDENEVSLTQLQDGLSEETLSALMKFLPTGRFESDDEAEEEGDGHHNRIDESNVCVAYTPKDVSVISETFKRLASQNEEKDEANRIAASRRVLLPLENYQFDEKCRTPHKILIEDGVVRIPNLLSERLCDLLRDEVNAGIFKEQTQNNNNSTEVNGFGNVINRLHRWDMYLKNEGVTNECLNDLFDRREKPLPILFHHLFDGQDSEFHELSALVSDAGANSQPIHPDSVFTEQCLMFTVFIALQDITHKMGATIFLPRTHNKHCHEQHKNSATKDAFINQCEFRESLLKKGDGAIMDSRSLHCGSENNKCRRSLFYMTLRRPSYFHDCNPSIPVGSKWAGLDLNVFDFLV